MDQSFDLPDSTDWLASSLPSVAPLESALRCQICKDFFNNPVITSCSHTFCSLCIRRCLSTEGKCPACRSSDQELKLRRNWAVQEIVESFQNARPHVLALARQTQTATIAEENIDLPQPATKKRRLNEPEEANVPAQQDVRRTRSSQSRQLEHPATPAIPDAVDDSKDEDYVPDDGLVPCPMCNRRMKEQAVFNHLDTCKGPTEERIPQHHSPFIRASPQPFQSLRTRTPAKTPERLPTLNYSLFKENVLRKKMKELGIPDWGPRVLLQRRHTEWMNLWNANCDAKIPKTKEELRRDLDVWERSQGGAAPQFGIPTGPNAVMAKSFDAAAWSANHDDDFKRLIENARKKKENKNAPAQKAPEEARDSYTIQPEINIDGESHMPSTAEGPMEVGEIPGNGPYIPFVVNGDVSHRAEGDSSSYPPT
ncbi:Postreplication repair E3 ubiquitin-protein ligase rad18 [Talaromyces atroroseus]|uniref:Postreplication repair E3 ubiquitin-protein ligase RAD18 n=1 Tax=Talaromyces atroroseus TaxID=1441469 RepID=A0A225AF20_TALAT|nr:Postreplication repair E3 ubiquitin-protein ligase rad18 [Talaromyces atroroseus]OKL57693.1 Postreplication repair E3 ubiquitin-protein ligase rad18 [Talaromyces atroroseus]